MILVHLIAKISLPSVIISMLLSLIIYLIIEAMSLAFFNKVMGISLNTVLVDPVERIIYFIPQFVIMFVIITISKIKKFRLVKLPESSWKYE